MDNTPPPQSEADQIAEIREALRLQELDAVEREQNFETLEAEVRQLRIAKQEMEAKLPVNLEDAIFTLDGKDYEFVYPALHVDGEKLTAMEMIDRPEILERLVKYGSAAIKLITKT